MKCPICDSEVNENLTYCLTCKNELYNPDPILGGITESDRNDHLRKRKEWEEEQRREKNEAQIRRVEQEKAQRIQQEIQRQQAELEKIQKKSVLYNQIVQNINENPYLAQIKFSELRQLDPSDPMLSSYESQIQTAVNLQNYTPPSPIYTPTNYSYAPPSYNNLNRFSFWDRARNFFGRLYIPRSVWLSVLSGVIAGYLNYLGNPSLLTRLFNFEFSLTGHILAWSLISFIIYSIMAARGDI